MSLFNIILCDTRLNFRSKCFMLLILSDGGVNPISYYMAFFGISEKTVYNALNDLFNCGYLLKGKYFILNKDYISYIRNFDNFIKVC